MCRKFWNHLHIQVCWPRHPSEKWGSPRRTSRCEVYREGSLSCFNSSNHNNLHRFVISASISHMLLSVQTSSCDPCRTEC
jgi:hypothetical protein